MKTKILVSLPLLLSITCTASLYHHHRQHHHKSHRFEKSEKSEKLYGNAVVRRVNTIYDAETFRVDIDGWPDVIGKNIQVRAGGFDAPEIKGRCAKERESAQVAKQVTVDLLQKGEVIELRNIRRGKLFRLVADVYIDDHSLAGMQLASGVSRPYSGGERSGWCKRQKK